MIPNFKGLGKVFISLAVTVITLILVLIIVAIIV